MNKPAKQVNPYGPLISVVVVALGVGLALSLYTVQEIEQVLVVRLGKPDRVVNEAGLHMKIPFIEKAMHFEKRLLVFDQEAQEILSFDKKNLKVDNYARWRIQDPLKFYRTVRNEYGASQRLNDIIYSNLREVLGQCTMKEIVARSRKTDLRRIGDDGREVVCPSNMMERIRTQANIQAVQYGVEIVDVRIKRADLPKENSKAVFRRMQTERERQAKQYRAEGEEEALKIRADADRRRAVILAEAYRKAETLRGAGDASAAEIYAKAYEVDPNFYAFYRSLEAYRKAFAKDTTVVSPPTGFFRLFKEAPKAALPALE